jgi:hypothetical protein
MPAEESVCEIFNHRGAAIIGRLDEPQTETDFDAHRDWRSNGSRKRVREPNFDLWDFQVSVERLCGRELGWRVEN